MGLENHLDSWQGIKVLVVGDVNLDVFLRVRDTDKTDPSHNFPILQVEQRLETLGGAANAAANLAAMGAEVFLVGLTGVDPAGLLIDKMMVLDHIGNGLVYATIRSGRTTSVKTRISGVHFYDESNLGIRVDSAANHVPDMRESEALSASMDNCANWAQGVLLSDYGAGTICGAVTDKVDEMQDLVVHLDPHRKYPHAMIGHRLDCMTPNTEEALLINKQCGQDLNTLGGPACTVVVTRGEDGCYVHEPHDANSKHYEVEPINYPHVCGAGDSFAAALLLSRIAGGDWSTAATMANAAGRACVLQSFTSPVNRAQIAQQLT